MRVYPNNSAVLVALVIWFIAYVVGLVVTYPLDGQRSVDTWWWVTLLSYPTYHLALFLLSIFPVAIVEPLSHSLLAQWGIALVCGYVQWFIWVPALVRVMQRASNRLLQPTDQKRPAAE